jgi:hypothetical protein
MLTAGQPASQDIDPASIVWLLRSRHLGLTGEARSADSAGWGGYLARSAGSSSRVSFRGFRTR